MLRFSLACIICEIILPIDSWHAYDIELFRNKSRLGRDCNLFENMTSPISRDKIQRYKLWPTLMNDDTYNSGKSLYGSEYALEYIWNHQHPMSKCSEKKYIITKGFGMGFGSVVHVEGTGFALALEMDRIYLPNPSGAKRSKGHVNAWQINNDYCKSLNKTNIECYFEPWSSCSYEDALGYSNVKSLSSFKHIDMSDFQNSTQEDIAYSLRILAMQYQNEKVLVLEHTGENLYVNKFIPTALHSVVVCSPLPTKYYYYWWRAVTATYILRPNNHTIAAFLLFNNGYHVSPQEYPGGGGYIPSVRPPQKRSRLKNSGEAILPFRPKLTFYLIFPLVEVSADIFRLLLGDS